MRRSPNPTPYTRRQQFPRSNAAAGVRPPDSIGRAYWGGEGDTWGRAERAAWPTAQPIAEGTEHFAWGVSALSLSIFLFRSNPSTLNPRPSTLNPQPSTLNPHLIRNPQSASLKHQPIAEGTEHFAWRVSARNLQPSALNRSPALILKPQDLTTAKIDLDIRSVKDLTWQRVPGLDPFSNEL